MFRRLYSKIKEIIGFDARPETNKEAVTSFPPKKPWIHIGNCPVCKDGLARIRACQGNSELHLYALCDECETHWLTPDLDVEPSSAEPEDPSCPICMAPMFSERSYWAKEGDLANTDWQDQVTIEQ